MNGIYVAITNVPAIRATVLAWADAEHDLSVGQDSGNRIYCGPRHKRSLPDTTMRLLLTATRQRLPEQNHVGADIIVLATKHLPRTAEPLPY